MKTIYTILFFLVLGGIAYAQFPSAFPNGNLISGTGTFNNTSTSSPTVGYLTATSTTATSTFAGSVKIGNSSIGTTSPFQIVATSTLGTPGSASSVLTYGSGNYTANGTLTLIAYWIYPFKTINGINYYSATPKKTATTSDDHSGRSFKITTSWQAVAGADGYRVMIWDQDIEGEATVNNNPYCLTQGICGSSIGGYKYIYYDTTGTSLVDGGGLEGSFLGALTGGIDGTKNTLIGPTGYGANLYVDAITGDLVSPNGGYFGKTSVGTVTVYRKNRQVVYYNATNTDSYSYGSVLTQAVDPINLQAGDLIVLKSGTYLINHMLLDDGVCVVGQGMENTIVQRENNQVLYQDPDPATYPGYSFIIFPNSAYSGCLKDLTVNITDLNRDAGIPIEIKGPSANTASSTFTFQNIHTIAEVDGFFPYNFSNNGMTVNITNWQCETKWDCFNATQTTQNTTINVYNSRLTCLGPDSTLAGCSPWATRISAQPKLTENIYNSLLWAKGGGVLHDVGMSIQAYTGHINLYNTEIRTDATSSTDVDAHIMLYGGANPTITSFGSYFNPNKITDTLGVKVNATVYGATLSTTTGEYINGNVGIGTTSPMSTLSVVGTTTAQTFDATSSLLLTYGSNSFLNARTTGNTGVGYLAGRRATGTGNVFVGNEAGTTTTTGSRNTSIGYFAGNGILTNNDNTSIGYYAGLNYSNTATRNTIIGSQAGISIGSSNDVTVLGYKAGNGLGGNQNTFIGSQSGLNLAQGSNNTFLGYLSGGTLTQGTGNTFLGMNAGRNIGNGSLFTDGYNTFVGDHAGTGFTSGTLNTILGSTPIYTTLTNATGTLFLGYNSASSSPDNLTNASAIGYESQVGCSNCMVLGGTNTYSVNIGIGTTTPYSFLSVKGNGATPVFSIGTTSESLTIDKNGLIDIYPSQASTTQKQQFLRASTTASNLIEVVDGPKPYTYFRRTGSRFEGDTFDAWYQPGAVDGSAQSTAAMAASSTYAVPFYSAQGGVISGIGVRVGANVAGSSVKCAIYDNQSDSKLYPTTYVGGSTIFETFSSTGMRTASTTVTILPNHLYWMVAFSTSTPSIGAVSSTQTSTMLGYNDAAVPVLGYSTAGATSAFPFAPFPTPLSEMTASVPTCFYQFSTTS